MSTSVENQRILYSKLNNREQVVHASIEEKGLVIKFNDKKTFILDNSIVPIVSDIKGYWAINGIKSDIRVGYDSSGKLTLPSVAKGENGNWFFDNIDTHYFVNQEYYSLSQAGNSIVLTFFFNDQLSFVLKGGKVLRVPVITDGHYIVPDYFFDHLIEKERKAESLLKQIGNGQAYFVYFTDAHWGSNHRNSPALIKHIIDYTPLEKVFFGGDVITNYDKDPQKALQLGYDFQSAFSFLGSDFYCVFGNHDDNSISQLDEVEKHLTESQVFSYLQSQSTNVNYGSFYNFYYDDKEKRTRYLCLDTGRFYYARFRGHSLQTAQFVVDALNTVPEGWHIIAISHIWSNLVSQKTGECKESTYVQPIISILEDYNCRIKSAFKYGGKTVDYDFRESMGKIEYCLGGHTHADYIVMSERGIPLITLTSDGTSQVAGTPSKKGTITEQCVGIIITDYQENKLHIIHVGRGDDVTIDLN